MSDYMRLLRQYPDFSRLWLAQVISLLGDWFNTIVLSALVAEYSGGSGLAVSGFLLARLVPPLLVGPYAGVLVDRFDRKRLLILSDVSRAGVVLLLLMATGPEWLWLIYVLTILQFSLSAVFEPGRNAIMPSLLPHHELVLANTLSSVTWSAMLAVGAIIGGVVAAFFGIAIALVIDALTFAVSALLIWRITLHPEYAHEVEEDEAEGAPQTGFLDGLRYLRRYPATLAVLLVKTGGSIGNVDALMVIYASTLFIMGKDSTTPLSIMYAAFGLGAVLGPILLNRFNDGSTRKMRRLIIVGFVWMTLGWMVMGGAATLPLVSAALVLRAMGGSANWTYSSVIIQKRVSDRYLGRMFSLDMAGFQLASAVSILVTGLLVDSVGAENVRQVVGLMAILSLIPLVLWLLAVPRLERAEAGQPVAPPVSVGD